MKIEIWADYACPFCYIGKTTLEQALEKTGLKDIEIVYKAFQLDPNAPKQASESTIAHLAHKYGVSLSEAERMVSNVVIHGKNVGLELRFDLVQQTNTFDAHRLTKYAKTINKDTELNKKLYEGYFTKGFNLADYSQLTELSTSLGLDSNEVLNQLESNKFETEVKRDIEEANRKGIHAVPYFLINGKVAIKGAQPLDRFVQILKEAQK